MEMILLITTVFCLSGYGLSASLKDQKLKVTVFTESYCPGCIDFKKTQLEPAFKTFSSNILIDLVPFGFTKQWYEGGHWKFRCQHGEQECYGNKLQACAIQEACGDQGSVQCGTKELGQVLEYIVCVEAAWDQKKASDKCAKQAGLVPAKITECATGKKGEYLLNLYGNRTTSFKPEIQYVPYVTIDDKHNKAAEENLHAEICRLRPSLCEHELKPRCGGHGNTKRTHRQ